MVADSHDHRAVRHRRNVRPHGRGDRQRTFRSDSRRVWLSAYFFSDSRRLGCGHGQCGSRICGCRRVHANFWNFQIYFRTACCAGGLDSGDAGKFTAGRKDIPGGVRSLSFLCRLRAACQTELARGDA